MEPLTLNQVFPTLLSLTLINLEQTHSKVSNNMQCSRNQVTLASQAEIIIAFNLLLSPTCELRLSNIILIQDNGLNHKLSSMKCPPFISAGKYATQPNSLFPFKGEA